MTDPEWPVHWGCSHRVMTHPAQRAPHEWGACRCARFSGRLFSGGRFIVRGISWRHRKPFAPSAGPFLRAGVSRGAPLVCRTETSLDTAPKDRAYSGRAEYVIAFLKWST